MTSSSGTFVLYTIQNSKTTENSYTNIYRYYSFAIIIKLVSVVNESVMSSCVIIHNIRFLYFLPLKTVLYT